MHQNHVLEFLTFKFFQLRGALSSAGTVTASALNGEVTTPNAAGVAQSGGALPLAAAMQVPAYSAAAAQQMPSAAQLPAQQMPGSAQLPAAQAGLTSASTSALGRRPLDQVTPSVHI